MARKFKLELRTDGLIALRQSGDVEAHCRQLMQSRMAAAGANDGYEIRTSHGGGAQARVHVVCVASTAKARKDNLQNNTLAKVVG